MYRSAESLPSLSTAMKHAGVFVRVCRPVECESQTLGANTAYNVTLNMQMSPAEQMSLYMRVMMPSVRVR